MQSAPTSTMGNGEACALAKATDRPMPVEMTAQLVVWSRRWRQTVERYTSAR